MVSFNWLARVCDFCAHSMAFAIFLQYSPATQVYVCYSVSCKLLQRKTEFFNLSVGIQDFLVIYLLPGF